VNKTIPTILLIEEGGGYLRSTFRLLLAFTVRVRVLENGRQAWKILFGDRQEFVPDLVILPWQNNDRTACDLVRRMRSEEDTREIPAVVTLDSSAEREDFEQWNFPLSFSFVRPLTIANLIHAIPILERSRNRPTLVRPLQEIVSYAF